MSDEQEDHALTEFLNQRLPQLGLDAETYAPYLLPLFTEEQQDAEEWESVLELLQASSETHSDDDQAFQDLRRDIEQAWQAHREEVHKFQQEQSAMRAQELEQTLAAERHAVQEALAEAERQKESNSSKATASGDTDDVTKRALLSRFAFEKEDGDDDDAEEEAPLTNKQVAEQAKLEAAQAMRGQSVQTKKEEQQKTAKAKLEKARLKEERRKKATKGERKR